MMATFRIGSGSLVANLLFKTIGKGFCITEKYCLLDFWTENNFLQTNAGLMMLD